MKSLALTLVVLGAASGTVLAQGSAQPAMGTQAPAAESQKTCGQKIAEMARYPKQNATVVTAVADAMEAHAQWMAKGDKAAKAESERLMKLAKEHREFAARANKMAATMTEMRNLPEARHDMANMPPALGQAMERQAREMRAFGQMLTQGADDLDRQRQSMSGASAPATGGSGEQPGTTPHQGTGGSGEEPGMTPQSGTGGSGMEPGLEPDGPDRTPDVDPGLSGSPDERTRPEDDRERQGDPLP